MRNLWQKSFDCVEFLGRQLVAAFSPSESEDSSLYSSEFVRPPVLGTTFSQLQCQYLGLDYKQTFQAIVELKLDAIRLCAYWPEIESLEGQFDFTSLDWLIEQSQQAGMEVTLAIGMKSPRWPEFHLPEWLKAQVNTTRQDQPLDADPVLRAAVTKYLTALLTHLQHKQIAYWQVENEALNKVIVANSRYLSPELITQEITLIKKIISPSAKILLTNSVNLFPFSDADEVAFRQTLQQADAVGLNVYTKVPVSRQWYVVAGGFFWRKLRQWRQLAKQQKREAWVIESQAEPWEWHQLVATTKLQNPSTSPTRMIQLVNQLVEMGYQRIFLWGCEYWYWQELQGNGAWMKAVLERKN
jgi:hypothetical protein